jgi:hypothetical protein
MCLLDDEAAVYAGVKNRTKGTSKAFTFSRVWSKMFVNQIGYLRRKITIGQGIGDAGV